MALTTEQTAYLNGRLGTPLPSDVEARLDRLGTVELVAVEVLEERVATMASGGPLNFTIPGDYSEDRTANFAAVRDMLELAQQEAGVNSATSTLRAVSAGTSRWGR